MLAIHFQNPSLYSVKTVLYTIFCQKYVTYRLSMLFEVQALATSVNEADSQARQQIKRAETGRSRAEQAVAAAMGSAPSRDQLRRQTAGVAQQVLPRPATHSLWMSLKSGDAVYFGLCHSMLNRFGATISVSDTYNTQEQNP